MAKVCIGIDFGGTFIKFGLMRDDMSVVGIFQLPTPVTQGPDAILQQIITGVLELMEQQGVKKDDVLGIGIGSPGPLSVSKGILLALPNIPDMENVPLRDLVSQRLGLPATLENDANAAAYGEFLCGAGKGCRDMVMLTLGTGVGSGIIHDGRIVHGRHDMGGELGHLIVQPNGRVCGCGQRGCLEAYSSAQNLAKFTTEKIRNNPGDSLLAEVLREKGQIDARNINEARKKGDALAGDAWQQCARYLAIGCIDICRVFDPDRIILAGGLTKAGKDLLEPVRQEWQNLNWRLSPIQTDLAIASLGSDAGVAGAAGVARMTFSENH